jgi:hypothetical protein
MRSYPSNELHRNLLSQQPQIAAALGAHGEDSTPSCPVNLAAARWHQNETNHASRATADCQPVYTVALMHMPQLLPLVYRQPCSCDQYTATVRHSHVCRKEGSAKTHASLALASPSRSLPTNHCYTVTYPSSDPPTQLVSKRTEPPDTQTKPQHMCLSDKKHSKYTAAAAGTAAARCAPRWACAAALPCSRSYQPTNSRTAAALHPG